MTTVRCPECVWTGNRKSDPPDAKPCPNGHPVKVGPWPPTSVDTLPNGAEVAFYDTTNIESGAKQRRRRLVDGVRFTSVTTVVGCLDKSERLIPWAIRLEREGKDWRQERDKAGDRGTSAHDVALAVLKGEAPRLSSMDPEHRPYGQAVMRFVAERRPKLILAEQTVAWREHRIAGRFDLYCELDGLRVRLDFKTVTEWKYDKDGKRYPPYPENALQLDLYEGCALDSGFDPSDYAMVVRLGPDGTYDEYPFLHDLNRGLRVLGAFRARQGANKALSAGLPEREAVA